MLYNEKAALALFQNEDVRDAVLAISKLADSAPKSSQLAILATLQTLGRIYPSEIPAINAVLSQEIQPAKSRQSSVAVDLMAGRGVYANSAPEDAECDTCIKGNNLPQVLPKTSHINDAFLAAQKSRSMAIPVAADPQGYTERLVVSAPSEGGPRSSDQVIADFSNDGQMMKEWAKEKGIGAVKFIKESDTEKIAEAISKWETKQAQN